MWWVLIVLRRRPLLWLEMHCLGVLIVGLGLLGLTSKTVLLLWRDRVMIRRLLLHLWYRLTIIAWWRLIIIILVWIHIRLLILRLRAGFTRTFPPIAGLLRRRGSLRRLVRGSGGRELLGVRSILGLIVGLVRGLL